MRLTLPIALLAALSSTPVAARGGPTCQVPSSLPRPMLEGPTSEEPRRIVPIGSYTLAVSWSPQYCASRTTSPQDRLQCGGGLGTFGFTLHGLWPDGRGARWPQYCKPTRLVPDRVVRDNLCVTPSVQLIQHEWEKHGTCMEHRPADYFARSAQLFKALRFPDMGRFHGRTVAALTFQQAFADANPGMRADQMRLNVNRQGWLEEVWLCLDIRFRHRTCPVQQGGAAPAATIRVR